jgi:hypothetical protein
MEYDSYVAIDWSGAKSAKKGIQVAECPAGTRPPKLIEPIERKGRGWTRSSIMNWIVSEVHNGKRSLIGFDFAFSFSFLDKQSYFPGHAASPVSTQALWKLVDEIC